MRTRLSLLAMLLAASCVSAPRQQPAPPPVRVVAPPPPAAPIARPTDWRDWPQTPGDWRYVAGAYGSAAEFGQPGARVFALGCDRGRRRLTLAADGAPSAASLTVRTTSLTRTLPVTLAGDPPAGAAALAAADPLLDAIGFSRGRFVVELPGAEPLVLPAWPEVERVVEDCRG